MPSENASDGIRYKVILIMTPQVLTILGSTGSIGESTLDVVSRHPEKFRVFALAGHKQVEKLAAQCQTFRPEYAVVADAEHAARLEALLKRDGTATQVLHGAQALVAVASADEVSGVMCAIVGAAGLPSALAAAQKAKPFIWQTKKRWWFPARCLWKPPAQTARQCCPSTANTTPFSKFCRAITQTV